MLELMSASEFVVGFVAGLLVGTIGVFAAARHLLVPMVDKEDE